MPHSHLTAPFATSLPLVTRRTALRWGASAAAAMAASGCGFVLRGAFVLNFNSIYLALDADPQLAFIVAQQLSYIENLKVITAPTAWENGRAEVFLQLTSWQGERVTLAKTASGQIRELELRLDARLILRDGQTHAPWGEEWHIQQRREMSYSESLALSKDEEEKSLQHDMRQAIASQIMRYLARASRPNAAQPTTPAKKPE